MSQSYTRALIVDTDSGLTNNSDFLVPSQKAIKTYVANNAGGSAAVGNTGDVQLKSSTGVLTASTINYSNATLYVTGSTIHYGGVTINDYSLPTTAGANNYVIASNGDGTTTFKLIQSGGGNGRIYYLDPQTSSDISGYFVALTMPSSSAETTITSACTGTGDFLVRSFATSVGEPNVTTMPAGTAYRHIHALVNGGTARLKLDMYKRSSGGTETLLRSGYSDNFSNTVVAEQIWTMTDSNEYTFLSTDRLVYKLYAARIAGSPGTVNVTIYFDGSNNVSFIQSTIVSPSTIQTLQTVYNNSTSTEIITDVSRGALTLKNGTGNADNVSNLFETHNSGGTITSFMRADGYSYFAQLTATTLSAKTILVNNADGGVPIVQIGSSKPVYFAANWPTVSYNAYWSAGNQWRYGAGSSSSYGGFQSVDPTTGSYDIYLSGIAGNEGDVFAPNRALSLLPNKDMTAYGNLYAKATVNVTNTLDVTGVTTLNNQLVVNTNNIISPLDLHGNINSYSQVNMTNLSGGTFASSDIVATANNGTETFNYIDMGINSSLYADPAFTINGPDAGYLYVSGGSLTIGTATDKDIIFHTNGTLLANERMRISTTGVTINGQLVPTIGLILALSSGNFLM